MELCLYLQGWRVVFNLRFRLYATSELWLDFFDIELISEFFSHDFGVLFSRRPAIYKSSVLIDNST